MKRLLALGTAASIMLLVACSQRDPMSPQTVGANISRPSAGTPTHCNSSSWPAGITEFCSGKLVYRDYIYDDYGAAGFEPGLPFPGFPYYLETMILTVTAGARTYPAGSENTADLVALELSLDGNQIQARFELNTVFDAHQTIAAIAVDTDNNADTGDVKLLGQTVHGADAIYQFNVADSSSNIIQGHFPLPANPDWKVWAVLAQADGTIMNVAFRGPNEEAGGKTRIPTDTRDTGVLTYFQAGYGHFFEDRQARALAAGDISEFNMMVSTADMRSGRTAGMIVGPGFHERVYRSQYPIGEGISLAGVLGRPQSQATFCGQVFNFLGKYMPYYYYLPKGPGPHGMSLVLHGCGGNPSNQLNSDTFQQNFASANDQILISPWGRGLQGFYSDDSERDVLDVMDDALQTFEIDHDRVNIAGYSMGGYGAMRFAALFPDRFASLVNWVGPLGEATDTPLPGNPLTAVATTPPLTGAPFAGAIGNMTDHLGNLRHVPGVYLYSGADYLVPLGISSTVLTRLQQEPGLQFDFYLHPVAEHMTYYFLDDWRKESSGLGKARRMVNPPRVSYRTDPRIGNERLDIRHDKAYWVSQIRGVANDFIDVQLHSLGCGKPDPVILDATNAGSDPVPWIGSHKYVAEWTPVLAANQLSGSLSNVASLRIDMAGACLRPGLTFDINSDTAVVLQFSDGRSLSLQPGRHQGVF